MCTEALANKYVAEALPPRRPQLSRIEHDKLKAQSDSVPHSVVDGVDDLTDGQGLVYAGGALHLCAPGDGGATHMDNFA